MTCKSATEMPVKVNQFNGMANCADLGHVPFSRFHINYHWRLQDTTLQSPVHNIDELTQTFRIRFVFHNLAFLTRRFLRELRLGASY